jgi:hypothetical protein
VTLGDVEEWLAIKFNDNPRDFIENDTKMLVVEVFKTPE